MTVLLVIVSLHHYGTILGLILLCALWFYTKELEESGLGKKEIHQEDITRAISIVTQENMCFTNTLISSHSIVSSHLCPFRFGLFGDVVTFLERRVCVWQHPKCSLISWICSTWRSRMKDEEEESPSTLISPPPTFPPTLLEIYGCSLWHTWFVWTGHLVLRTWY